MTNNRTSTIIKESALTVLMTEGLRDDDITIITMDRVNEIDEDMEEEQRVYLYFILLFFKR